MNKRCKYIKPCGYDVLCTKPKQGYILGDIIGYDGSKCDSCKYYFPCDSENVSDDKDDMQNGKIGISIIEERQKNNLKSVSFNMRMTDEERREYIKIAKRRGISLSALIRILLCEEKQRIGWED